MTPGEKYRIQVNTVSYGVESNQPQEVTQTVSEYYKMTQMHQISFTLSYSGKTDDVSCNTIIFSLTCSLQLQALS